MSTTSIPTGAAVPPRLDTFITVPELLNFHLEHNPTQPAYVFTPMVHDGKDDQDEPTEISYLELVRASRRGAHLIRPKRAGSDGQVIAMLALSDNIVYQTVVAAIMEAGFIPLLISPRLTAQAVINLLRKTGCHRILSTQNTLKVLLQEVLAELAHSAVPDDPVYGVTIDEIPSLHQLYPKLGLEVAKDAFEPEVYPGSVSYPKEDDVAIYLHSSGSTGMPKAIGITHSMLIHTWASNQFTSQLLIHKVRLGVMPLPPFHAMGFYTQFVVPVFASITAAMYPPTVTHPNALPVMPTPANILPCLKRTKADFLIIVPAMLQIWAHEEESIEILKGLKGVMFAGGPLAPSIGDLLVSHGVHLRSVYGGTEFGIPVEVNIADKEDDKDWSWSRFAKETKPRWIPQGDGSSELQLVTTKTHILAVNNLEDVPGYSTADIFGPHPTRHGLWKIIGRVDDVIIHSSGEKTVPIPIESIVMKSPLVQGAVMFGRQRDQAGILIEPTPGNEINVEDDAQVSQFRNKIWPIIEEANRVAPAFSRIYKEMILFSAPHKPLPRAAKGTIMRKAVYQTYEKEIDQVYNAVESNVSGGSTVPPPSWDLLDVQQWFTLQVEDLCGHSLTPSDDIFEHGFDSLCATILRLRIVNVLSNDPSIHAASRLITQNVVYTYPSIDGLSKFIVELVHDPSQSGSDHNHEEAMEEMIQRYSQGLDGLPNSDVDAPAPVMRVVLLTGSTGNLGAQILAMLISNETVARIYTLNRSSSRVSMLDRHKERFRDKALDISLLLSEKLVFLEGDSSRPNLGLSDDVHNELKENLTLVIHNAWRLDFNLSLSSFEPHIRGTRNLIDLSRSCRHASSLRFLFTSSIGSTQSWDASKGPYPEEVVMDSKFAVGAGYGESKYVSERILHKSGLHASSFRIGQISGGAPNGAWAITDWLPIIVKSSLALNMLPDAHGLVSWVPMDAIAEAILDAGFVEEHPPMAMNLVHPHPVTWSSVMEVLRRSLLSAKELRSDALPLVPFDKWLAALEESAAGEQTEKTASGIPAIKILDFIRGLAQADDRVKRKNDASMEAVGLSAMNTRNIQRISSLIRNLEPIGARDAELWIKYWVQCGM